jgi:glycine betaine transporter
MYHTPKGKVALLREAEMDVGDILVPTDFSESSLRALDFALSIISPDGEIYLLHVIDSKFVDQLAEHEFAGREEAIERLRREADARLDSIISERQSATGKTNKMIVIGLPFIEVLRIAKDLDFSLIAMGVRGGTGPLEEILFGGTADKVLRGTRIPVVCVP